MFGDPGYIQAGKPGSCVANLHEAQELSRNSADVYLPTTLRDHYGIITGFSRIDPVMIP